MVSLSNPERGPRFQALNDALLGARVEKVRALWIGPHPYAGADRRLVTGVGACDQLLTTDLQSHQCLVAQRFGHVHLSRQSPSIALRHEQHILGPYSEQGIALEPG